jgi:hypothetical protein
MQSLKFGYNPAFFERLCPLLNSSIPGFDDRIFIFGIFDNQWPDLELKDRVRQISLSLNHFLGEDFPAACNCLVNILKNFQAGSDEPSVLALMIITDYIDVFGREHCGQALDARKSISKEDTIRKAVNPFLAMPRTKPPLRPANGAGVMIKASANDH